jgi:hypothetical protein
MDAEQISSQETKQINYRGWKSTTLQLVLLSFLIGTLMLLLGKIDGSQWVGSVFALIATYSLRDIAAKGIEVYRDIKT